MEKTLIIAEAGLNHNGDLKTDLRQFMLKLNAWRFYHQVVPNKIKRFSGFYRALKNKFNS